MKINLSIIYLDSPAEVELFYTPPDYSVGVNEEIGLESFKIKGEEFLNALTPDTYNDIIQICWRELYKQKKINQPPMFFNFDNFYE